MGSLTTFEQRTIYGTIQRLEQVRKKPPKELGDLFAEKPRLIITPNNNCANACLHCVADSTPGGEIMPYTGFTGIDTGFINIFSVADFGRRGNPLLYDSEGHDIVDLMDFLNQNGINSFTLALAIQRRPSPVIDRLKEFVREKRVGIETMVTYHHYFDPLDTDKLARDFNNTLRSYMQFSDKILISLLGDEFSQQDPTKAQEVQATFQDNWEAIFRDIHLTQEKREYHAECNKTKSRISIPSIDTRVYAFGRFRQYLSQRGVLEEYERQFEESMGEYACPDLIRWPGIILEPNGDLNFCASFEAINCNHAVVSNILDRPYPELQADLMQFHQREVRWFIDNLPDIVDGKVSMCKLKNKCYQK